MSLRRQGFDAGRLLDDIGHISRISGVVLRGRHFDRPGLEKILEDVMAAPDVAANDWPRKK